MKERVQHNFLIAAITGFQFAEVPKGDVIKDSDGIRTDESYLAVLFKKCARRATFARSSKNRVPFDKIAANLQIRELASKYIADNYNEELDRKALENIRLAIQKDEEFRVFGAPRRQRFTYN